MLFDHFGVGRGLNGLATTPSVFELLQDTLLPRIGCIERDIARLQAGAADLPVGLLAQGRCDGRRALPSNADRALGAAVLQCRLKLALQRDCKLLGDCSCLRCVAAGIASVDGHAHNNGGQGRQRDAFFACRESPGPIASLK